MAWLPMPESFKWGINECLIALNTRRQVIILIVSNQIPCWVTSTVLEWQVFGRNERAGKFGMLISLTEITGNDCLGVETRRCQPPEAKAQSVISDQRVCHKTRKKASKRGEEERERQRTRERTRMVSNRGSFGHRIPFMGSNERRRGSCLNPSSSPSFREREDGSCLQANAP
jgi:hypothetical protein